MSNNIFIIVDFEYINTDNFYEILHISGLKICKKKKLEIIEQFTHFIKPVHNKILSKEFIERTGITTEILNIVGIEFNSFVLNFNNFCKNNTIITYNNQYDILFENFKYHKVLKLLPLRCKIKSLKEIIEKEYKNKDISGYNSSNIYNFFNIKIEKDYKITTRWNTISIYLTLNYLVENKKINF